MRVPGRRRRDSEVVASPARRPGSGGRSRTRSRGAARTSRCSPATATASPRPPRRSRSSADARSSCPSTSPTPSAVEAAAATVEDAARVRSTSGSTTRWRRSSRRCTRRSRPRVRARHRGHLPGHRVRDDGRPVADAPRAIAASIVQVGSALSYRAIPLQSAYCGAKFAIRGFTDSVRTELLHDKSRVWITMVQLPAVNTPQFDWCLTQAAAPSPAGAADLPARGPGRGGVLGCAPPPPRAVGRPQHRQGDPRQQARALARRPLPRQDRLRLAADPGHAGRRPTARTTCSSRVPGWPRRTASSTTRRSRAARSCG